MTDSKLLIMLGSGPGIGVGVSSYFAARGFNKIALLSRTAERLQIDADSVKKAASPGTEIKTYAVDLADTKAIEKALVDVEKDLGTPEVVVYNASHLTQSKLFEYGEGEIEVDLKVICIPPPLSYPFELICWFKIATLGLYTVSKHLLSQLATLATKKPNSKPTLLVTSGGLFKSPFSPYFSLSLSKAAQHSLTMSLAQEYVKKGVHVAAMVVHGLVKPEGDKYFGPSVIAEVYWRVYEQGKDGEKEVWISPPEADKESKEWMERKRTEAL
jgi:NAD(P)-dependent dehydrogenase (short-subunit alcohol dehydrogenase family)